ncbi:salviol synthase-like [Salvia hispanica]|uniref:salviol synthase-like n=1 Tax=Salvia hispanica TaxID=49212 RepID=UPI002009AA02|nr:salviol synthase-like [Salvia hispanica]XP_047966764.1 salviol synthase-like [Salvia hispanica]
MEFNIVSTIIALLSFLVFVFMFLKSQTISKYAKTYSHIPGPKTLPLIGNLHLMLRADSPPHMFRQLAAKHGPLMHLQLGEVHFVIISSVDFAKQVTRTHDINFANRPPGLMMEKLTYNYSDIVTASYGDQWRHLRRICTLEFLSARRVQSFRRIREEESLSLCKQMASCEGSPADLSGSLCLMSYDVTTRVVVGAKTRERGTVTSIIQESIRLGAGFMLADLYPSIKLLPLITGARFKAQRMYRKLDKLFDSIVEQHKAAGDGGDLEDLVDVLLRIQQDGTEFPLTTDNIKAVVLNMFVAGTDTATVTMEWAMSEMMRNPSVLNKAQKEVRKVFDNKGYVDEARFDELKYMKLIIKETLRLHPALPLLIPRMNVQRCEIDGYEIPAKTSVIVNAWALGRDPKYWNDADKFIPERFEESSVDFKGNNLEYIPFGAGRRMCPGMSFGLANVELLLAMLLYHFDWKMPYGKKQEDLDMTETFGSAFRRKHPLHLVPIVKRPLPASA